MSRRTTAPKNLLGGIIRLVCFDRSGFAVVGNTPQAFLSSLSPLIAFLLVGSALEVLSWGWRTGVGDGLQTLCVVLGQPVISNYLARRWKREDRWFRYATAMNWCQVAIPVLGALLLTAALLLGSLGFAPRVIAYGAFGVIFFYATILNWFLAWRGLDLSVWRAIGFLVLVTLGLAAVLAIPVALRAAQVGLPAMQAHGVTT
jgi:hypothetical protein